jgi:flagellin-specific chaperone FliS
MSKVILWQYNEFVQSRKEKLVNMLISEIIFLKTRAKRAINKDEISYLNTALDKLDYLLNKLKDNSSDMPEEDFDKIIIIVYNIFKEITNKLE